MVVGAAFGVLLYENRNQWFGGDEWNIITDRGLTAGPGHDGLLEPHFEHWSTLPIAVYRLLFAVFGLHSYWPYVVVLVVVHIAIVVLLWHVMVRAGVDPWVATAGAAVFAVLGTGFENLTGAWQAQLIAPLALGLGAVLLLPTSGRFARRDVLASALLLLAVMCSGVALAMLVVVALVQLARRGLRVAVATVAVPVAAYVAWYLAYGRYGRAVTNGSLSDVPDFVWRGTTRALGDVARVEVLGPIVVLAVMAWLAVRLVRAPRDPRLVVPFALAVGGVAFLASTGFRRASLFMSDPAASRYAYVTVAFLLPLVALAAQGVLSGHLLRRVVLVGVTVTLLIVQIAELDREASSHAVGEQADRGAVLATAQLAREQRRFLLRRPLYAYEPQVTVDEIVSMDRDGKLPSLHDATERDRLTVLARLDLVVGPGAAISGSEPPVVVSKRHVAIEPDSSGCARVRARGRTPEVVLHLDAPTVFAVRGAGPIVLHLRDTQRRIDGEPVTFYLQPGRDDLVSVGSADDAVVVVWFPHGGASQRGRIDRMCDIDALSEQPSVR